MRLQRTLSSAALDRMFELRKIEDAYAQSLGKLVVAAGWLEYAVHRLCWTVIDVGEDRGVRITGPLAFRQITRMIRSVGDATVPPAAHPRLVEVLKDAERSMDERNQMLHATWVTHTGVDPPQLRLRMRPLESTPVSISEIDDVTRRLRGAAHALALAGDEVARARAEASAGTPDLTPEPGC